MKVIINLGEKESTLETLNKMKERLYAPFDIRITNSHITTLNTLIGDNVFKKDALYINSFTLWEIMQPIGGKGKHNYHGLTPKEIYDALRTMRHSKDITLSYDRRYLIVTLATILDGANLIAIVKPDCKLQNEPGTIIKIITIYPMKIKK